MMHSYITWKTNLIFNFSISFLNNWWIKSTIMKSSTKEASSINEKPIKIKSQSD
jgi:hypothetical protein